MMMLRMTSALFAALALVSCTGPLAPVDPASSAVAAPVLEQVSLSAPDGRAVALFLEAPAEPRGVLLFSHGAGNSPSGMKPFIDRMAGLGFAVVAPLHTDSLSLSEDRRTGLREAFPTRAADMRIAADYAAERFPAIPMAAVGHSYGALSSLVAGGAFSPMVPGKVNGLKAVVMFSSPGKIDPLFAMPNAFDQVDEPVLLITGTADTVEGTVADPASHLAYFENLPAGQVTAIIVKDGTHRLIYGETSHLDEVWPLAANFLAANLLGDKSAAKKLAEAGSTAELTIRRR